MQTTINGKKFSITFAYGFKNQTLKFDGELQEFECETTTCQIDRFNPLTQSWVDAGTGSTICSPCDQFIKNEGRKESLTRALAAGGFDREHRTKLWACYNNRGVKAE